MITASWVIVSRATGHAVMETFSRATAEKINPDKYLAVPILEYLQSINRNIARATGK